MLTGSSGLDGVWMPTMMDPPAAAGPVVGVGAVVAPTAVVVGSDPSRTLR